MQNLRPSSDLLSENVPFIRPAGDPYEGLKFEKPNSEAHFFQPSVRVGIVLKAWALCKQAWHSGPGQ